jgi:signal peptidase I
MVTTTAVPDPSTPVVSTGAGQVVGPVLAWGGLVLVLLARTYRAFLLTLVVIATVPTLLGPTSHLIRSGSMEPAVSVGDVVIGTDRPDGDPVPVGRVMIFDNPDSASPHGTLVHRVMENLGDGTYVTAGDGNRDNDSTPVPAESFHSRATLCIPFVGLPVVWWAEHRLLELISWLVLTAAAFYFSSRPPCDPRHRRRRERNRAARAAAAGSAALKRLAVPVTVAASLVLVATVALTSVPADAAFSARTVTKGSTWTAAVNTSRATSTLTVYDTASASGWYQRGSVSVNISATAKGTTVRSLTYRVNGGLPVTTRTSSLTFTLATQGDNVITYWATDGFGASESPRTAHVRLDSQPPTLNVTSTTGDRTHAQWRASCVATFPGTTGGVCGTVADGVGSGVARVEYVVYRSSDARCFDGQKWTSVACNQRTAAVTTSGRWFAAVPDATLPSSRAWYTMVVYATDVAGNTVNTTRSFSVG